MHYPMRFEHPELLLHMRGGEKGGEKTMCRFFLTYLGSAATGLETV